MRGWTGARRSCSRYVTIRVKRSSILTAATGRLHLPAMARTRRCLSVMPPLVWSRNPFPSRTQRSRKRHTTETNSLPSMLSSMTTSAAAAIVSFASSSSLTSTSKRTTKPPTLRVRDRRGDESCTTAVRSDHEIDEVNHTNLIYRLDVIRLSLNIGPRSNRRGSVPLTSMPYFSTCRNPLQRIVSTSDSSQKPVHVYQEISYMYLRLSRGSHGSQPLP
jgi:hypothetical protein